MGKGLEWAIIMELLWYSSITLIPIALPLSTLLASMMLTGKLAEKSEITAINSLGQPFTYILTPLLLFSMCIGLSSFLISNYSIPYAELKASTLRYDIMRKKLNINIKEKIFFSDIEGYSIRVNEKNNNILKDIIIYDYSNQQGINKIFIAKSGEMSITNTNDNNYLIINLHNGKSYSEVINDEEEYVLQTKFKQYKLALDLSSFEMERTTEGRFSNRARTMNIKQLNTSTDSLKSDCLHLEENFLSSFKEYTSSAYNKITIAKIRKNAENYKKQRALITTKINKFNVELHRKFTLSLACIIMLLIGSSIGAIIKKGGFGLPVVFSIILFLIYHILSITGEKMVKKGVIDPIIGMWTPSVIILTIGILLIFIVNNHYLEKIWIKR